MVDLNQIQASTISLKYTELNYKNIKAQTNSENIKDKIEMTDIESYDQFIAKFQIEVLTNSQKNLTNQSSINSLFKNVKFDLSSIEYNGKPITELSVEEATGLVSEDGYFGVKHTSTRIADFVLAGAGDDIEKLRAGREGIARGFKEAEKLWGGKLPDISYETIEKALTMVDEKIAELGESILDVEA